MPERTVIQWDKDDLDAAGLLKVDVLALGMLTALRRAFAFIGQRRGTPFAMQDIPPEDPATYDMICRADTMGAFQIESRAQMGMLPRLRPRCFYDLVIEVAIVRPGPIQGGMVHPYLKRRQGLEPIAYENDDLKPALARTLGVPIFQEQVMQIAMIAAGFSAGEADELRRAMAAWRRTGNLAKYRDRIIQGMTAKRYTPEFAESIFRQIQGFSEYGFPESHAASFAMLVYVSCWIKCHEPAAFLAALLNSQPMGFYTPGQLVQDARRHGVEVRPVDVLHSEVDCTLEETGTTAGPAVRLGLRMVGGLSKAAGERIVQARQKMPPRSPALPPEGAASCLGAARKESPWPDAQALARSAALERRDMQLLAAADALVGLAGHRRQQMWDAAGWHAAPALLRGAPIHEAPLQLPQAPEAEAVAWDLAATRLSLRSHPMALLRPGLARYRLKTSQDLRAVADGQWVRTAGIVTVRQQPPTAQGTTFVSLEDEFGSLQVIVWRHVRQAQGTILKGARLLAVQGRWQREGEVCNLIASRLADLSVHLEPFATGSSRDFR
jgi:error-prone DNA polymerase